MTSHFVSVAEKWLPEWRDVPLHQKLMLALHDKGFFKPTPIQAEAVPIALENRDVVGVAQTAWRIFLP